LAHSDNYSLNLYSIFVFILLFASDGRFNLRPATMKSNGCVGGRRYGEAR